MHSSDPNFFKSSLLKNKEYSGDTKARKFAVHASRSSGRKNASFFKKEALFIPKPA
jgi:hypothetical protein